MSLNLGPVVQMLTSSLLGFTTGLFGSSFHLAAPIFTIFLLGLNMWILSPLSTVHNPHSANSM